MRKRKQKMLGVLLVLVSLIEIALTKEGGFLLLLFLGIYAILTKEYVLNS